MEPRTYLMSFEQMIRFVDYHREEILGVQVMNYSFPTSDLCNDEQSVILSNELFEKLDGTWWEVEFNARKKKALRSFYLADSLQDALRLRPCIDTSYWGSLSDNTSDFLADVNDWTEWDECFVD